jgi:hypothetical protein
VEAIALVTVNGICAVLQALLKVYSCYVDRIMLESDCCVVSLGRPEFGEIIDLNEANAPPSFLRRTNQAPALPRGAVRKKFSKGPW